MRRFLLACLLSLMVFPVAADPVDFVVQLTRSPDNYGHRRVLMQIAKALDDIGEDRVRFTVVAYEEGIHALLEDNEQTRELVAALARRGVVFHACRISMKAWGLDETQFPLEVDFVPAGAPDVIRLQLAGYKYWHP